MGAAARDGVRWHGGEPAEGFGTVCLVSPPLQGGSVGSHAISSPPPHSISLTQSGHSVRQALTAYSHYVHRIKPGLAVTTATRSEVLPDLPTVGEFVPGYEVSTFVGIGAPRNTPAEIIDKLNVEVNAALADPKMTDEVLTVIDAVDENE